MWSPDESAAKFGVTAEVCASRARLRAFGAAFTGPIWRARKRASGRFGRLWILRTSPPLRLGGCLEAWAEAGAASSEQAATAIRKARTYP